MEDSADMQVYEPQYRTVGVCQIEITRPFCKVEVNNNVLE
jgi:hypothetical protein